MAKEFTTVEIHDKVCHICQNGSDDSINNRSRQALIFYWGIAEKNEDSIMTVVSYLESRLRGRMPYMNFILVAYESGNWNNDFSPWEAQAAFGNEDFGGNADRTLKWLLNDCIPYIEAENSVYIKEVKEVHRFVVGYSLAGLFALWAYGESSLFAGAVSCSGSLWYKGWLDYAEEHKGAFIKDGTGYIYLSLGEREEKTKNRMMSTVGDNTRKMYAFLCEEQEAVKCILEWNAGSHFSEPNIRVAKGIYWILNHFVV